MTILVRLPDWTEQHIAFLDARREMPFAWGSNDCAIFFADHTRAITGIDLAKTWRGYKTAKGAAARIAKAGGMRELAAAAGLVEKHRGFAQRGDGVLAVMDGRETFGVVSAGGYWCGPGADGLAFRPMHEAIAVFGV